MITKDVREWLKKVENRQYSYEDVIYELNRLSPILSREDLQFIKRKITDIYR